MHEGQRDGTIGCSIALGHWNFKFFSFQHAPQGIIELYIYVVISIVLMIKR